MRPDRIEVVKLSRTPPDICATGEALEGGRKIAQGRLPHETGGIVLGWRDTGCIHVERLIEVRDSNAQRVTYERNHAAAQVALKAAIAEEPSDTLLGYVGEWHSHPAPQSPSRQDRKELRAIGRMIAQPVVLIVLATSGGGDWHPYAMTAAGRTIRATAVRMKEEP